MKIVEVKTCIFCDTVLEKTTVVYITPERGVYPGEKRILEKVYCPKCGWVYREEERVEKLKK